MAFRVVNQAFWDDAKVLEDYSVEDKYFWLYLLTNPQANYLGVYQLPLKISAVQLGWSTDQIRVMLDRFENKYHKVKFDRENQEIAIGEYLYHGIVKGGKPVLDAIKRDINSIKNYQLVVYVLNCTKEYISRKQALVDIYNYIYNYLKELNVNVDVYDKANVDESYHESSKQKTTTEREKRFIDFWSRYPKKVSKAQAEKAFDKINPDDKLYQVIVDALEKQKVLPEWQKANGQFIPYASTWLNNKRWTDEIETQQRQTQYYEEDPEMQKVIADMPF